MHRDHASMTRRELLRAGGGAAAALSTGGLLTACGSATRAAGLRADVTVRASATTVELGSRSARTWTYGGSLPGAELRLRQGVLTRVRVVNDLPQPTSIHWHGLRIENRFDGVPGMTQKAIPPGGEFLYELRPPDAGTYFFHSHVGVQLDRGLYAPLVVEARSETLSYDRDVTVMIDDWLDGLGMTPDRELAMLEGSGMKMGSMSGGAMSMGSGSGSSTSMGSGSGATGAAGTSGMAMHTDLRGRAATADSLAGLANAMAAGRVDPGDVRSYPLYLVNGRPPEAPATLEVARGERVRLRLINPSADTIYCVFVEGHELEVVAADGGRVSPVRTDALVLGMGERYDVMLDARGAGSSRLIAMPLGKRGRAGAILRYKGERTTVPNIAAPVRMPARVLGYGDLRRAEQIGGVPSGTPRVIALDLAQGPGNYSWTIGGQAFPKADPIAIRRGESIRFAMRNLSSMPHPMHLHGHVVAVGGGSGPLKDTAIALPKQTLVFDWVADNVGIWAFHCHNVYHQMAGMMRRVIVA